MGHYIVCWEMNPSPHILRVDITLRRAFLLSEEIDVLSFEVLELPAVHQIMYSDALGCPRHCFLPVIEADTYGEFLSEFLLLRTTLRLEIWDSNGFSQSRFALDLGENLSQLLHLVHQWTCGLGGSRHKVSWRLPFRIRHTGIGIVFEEQAHDLFWALCRSVILDGFNSSLRSRM